MVILLTFSRSYNSSELHTHEVLDGHACVVYGFAHHPSIHCSHQGTIVLDSERQSSMMGGDERGRKVEREEEKGGGRRERERKVSYF